MADNTLDQLVPKIAARGLLDFRQKAFMPQIVNADYSAEAAQKGDRVSVLVPTELTVKDVVPGEDQVAPTTSNPRVENIELDHWKSVSFYLTDKELMQIDADEHFLPFQMTQAISALATAMNTSFMNEGYKAEKLLGNHKKPIFSGEVKFANTVHGGVQAAIDGRKMLNAAGAPKEGRFGIIGYDEEARATELGHFADVSQSGDKNVRMEGELGRKFGIDWISTDQIVKNRTLDTSLTVTPAAVVSKGDTEARFRGLTIQPKVGDVLIRTTNDEIFGVVKSVQEMARHDYRLYFYEPVPQSLATNQAVKFADAVNNNLIFQRNAFAFATRPLAAATQHVALGSRIISLTDPVTGLSLRLEIYRQHKQTVWEFDALWGVKLVRPEFAIRALST